jgi:hypothetical protein
LVGTSENPCFIIHKYYGTHSFVKRFIFRV